MANGRIYLDYASATPVDVRVLSAMSKYSSDQFYNPSAIYSEAVAVRASLEEARATVGRCMGARPSEIIFTAGGTESTNLAIHGVMSQYAQAKILVSAVEHEAVLRPAEHYIHAIIPVDRSGIINLSDFSRMIDDNTVMVSVMLVNNEVGTIQPIRDISTIIKSARLDRAKRGVKLPLYLHTDAAQAPMHLDINTAQLGVDLMSLNGGKIYGPKQSGVLYFKTGTILRPMIEGGGQEWGYRSGTENVAQSVGFAQALSLSEKGRAPRAKKVRALRDFFIVELESRFNATIIGSRKQRIANNIFACFDGIDNERVLFKLDELGVAVATGSACSASSDEPSHVLLAMGYGPSEARSSIRFTLGKDTAREELEMTLDLLKQAL